MTCRPEIQRRAQEELDRVCPGRLVTFEDRGKLPYVESVIMEVIRYHPIVPSGLPHTSEKEDVWEGMRIPKGSMIIGNIWWITLKCDTSVQIH